MKKEISSLHVPHNKHTAGCEPVRIALPREVVLPMNMHSGHDAVPVVAVGDHVKVGQMIAREEGRFRKATREYGITGKIHIFAEYEDYH